VLVSELSRPSDAHHVARNVLEHLRPGFDLLGTSVALTASVGVSVFPDDAHDADTLQRHADAAMERAKGDGKNRVAPYPGAPADGRGAPTDDGGAPEDGRGAPEPASLE
jgi:diguanylate cyclase